MKFVRDELYYYSRDENQFFRRRRTLIFAWWRIASTCVPKALSSSRSGSDRQSLTPRGPLR